MPGSLSAGGGPHGSLTTVTVLRREPDAATLSGAMLIGGYCPRGDLRCRHEVTGFARRPASARWLQGVNGRDPVSCLPIYEGATGQLTSP